MSWFQRVKDQTNPIEVGRWLGMDPGPMSSMGPCPSCKADERGDDDSRGPIGVGSKGGWKCFRCGAQGDVVELVAQALLGIPSESLDGTSADTVRTWFVEHGVALDDEGPRDRGGRRGASPRPAKSVADLVGGSPRRAKSKSAPPPSPETEPPPGAPEGTFSWSEDLVPRCEVALWADTPEAARARVYLTERRCLAEASLRALRVGLYVHPDGRPWIVEGRPILVIPLQDQHARPVNVKFRAVPVVGTCEHCDSEDGCKKCRSYRACRGRPLPLFGAQLLSEDREKPVVVVEGELDAIAMHSMGFRSNIVSTTAGAGVGWSDEWLDAVEPYSTIFGLYDDDEAGSEGWAKASATLGPERCSRAVPPGGKDINAVLIAGVREGRTPKEVAQEIVRSIALATPSHGMAMRRPHEFADDVETLVAHPDRLRGLRTGSAKLDKALGGWRPGVIVVSGESGQGKTTFTTWATLMQARFGEPVLITSFEQRPIGSVQKLLRCQVGGDFTHVSEATRRDALAALSELDLFILDHYGNIPLEKLIEAIKYAKRRQGIRFFMIDHLGFLIDPDSRDERLDIQRVMRALAILAKVEGVVILLVCHVANFEQAPGKATRPTMRNLKGGSAIRQDADEVIIVVSKPASQAEKRDYPISELHLDKVRSEFGTSGACVRLAFDPGATSYADTWEETPAGEAGKIVPR